MFRFFSLLTVSIFLCACSTSSVPSPHGTYDPKWAPFTPYIQRLIGRVQKKWEEEITRLKIPPPVGATVTVIFWISPDGNVSRIEEVKSAAGGLPTEACVSAITLSAPFGHWTEEMKKLLETGQKMTFTFTYQ